MKSIDGIDIDQNIHIFSYEPKHYIGHLIKHLEDRPASEPDHFYFVANDPEDAKKHFLSFYKQQIEAAGGVVKNEKGDILFIHRLSKWDLPKGKIDIGETPLEAAKREIREECGLKTLTFVKELQPTFHTYYIDKNRVLKKTFWFEFSGNTSEPLHPQAEESITEVKWMDKQETETAMENTYASIKEVIREGT